jgi:hypothetical protein
MITKSAGKNKKVTVCTLAGVLTLCLLCIILLVPNIELLLDVPFSIPSESFRAEDLVGTWRVSYMEWGTDTIVIRPDGSYKQIYKEKHGDNYTFESPWNKWFLEKLKDGGFYIHFVDGKYFMDGKEFAIISGGTDLPCADGDFLCKVNIKIPFTLYDWTRNEFVDSTNELILNVRVDPHNNETLLFHLWSSPDRGFPLIGGKSEFFQKDDSP